MPPAPEPVDPRMVAAQHAKVHASDIDGVRAQLTEIMGALVEAHDLREKLKTEYMMQRLAGMDEKKNKLFLCFDNNTGVLFRKTFSAWKQLTEDERTARTKAWIDSERMLLREEFQRLKRQLAAETEEALGVEREAMEMERRHHRNELYQRDQALALSRQEVASRVQAYNELSTKLSRLDKYLVTLADMVSTIRDLGSAAREELEANEEGKPILFEIKGHRRERRRRSIRLDLG